MACIEIIAIAMRCLVLLQLFGKTLKGSNFWKAAVDELGGTDPVTLLEFFNEVSKRHPFIIDDKVHI